MSEPQPPVPAPPDPARAVERLRETFTPLLKQLSPEVEPITVYSPAAHSALPATEKQSS